MGSKLLVRAYNVGFGDCFYVRIPNADDGFHILIDCGKKGSAEPLRKALGHLQSELPDAGGGTGPGLDFDQPPLPPSASLRGPTPPAASQTMAVSSSPLGPAAKAIPRSTVVPASATDALSPTPRRSVANDPPPPLPLALRGAAL